MKISIVISALFLLMFNSFIYKCKGQTNELPTLNDTSTTDTVFFEIDPKYKGWHFHFEEEPEFPGGEKAMIKYISENTNYPLSAIKDSISGLLRLVFIIDIDGSTKIFKVYKSIQTDIDNECIRVVKEMPRWKPGSTVFRAEKGLYRKIIPVYYAITFNFMLSDVGENRGIIIKPR
jgi:hypothetical protein